MTTGNPGPDRRRWYHTGLWVTIGLLAAGVLVSYVTLRPRGRAGSEPAASEPSVAVAELAVVDELAGAELLAAKEGAR